MKILYELDSIIVKDYLIIADLHLGYELDLIENEIYFPRISFFKLKEKIEKILKKEKIYKLIINGDFKHKFSKHTKYGWKEIEEFIKFLNEKFDEIIFIRGNHDTFLRKYVELYDYIEIGNYFITHGHKYYETSKKIIIGHEHPSVELYFNDVKYRFKVFVEGKKTFVLPSFSDLFIGNPINVIPKEEYLSEYLKRDELEYIIFENGKRIKFNKLCMHPID